MEGGGRERENEGERERGRERARERERESEREREKGIIEPVQLYLLWSHDKELFARCHCPEAEDAKDLKTPSHETPDSHTHVFEDT